MKPSRALALCLLFAAAGCKDATELMLIVKAAPGLDVGPGGEINALRVSVQPASGDPTIFTYTRSIALCSLTQQGQPDCRPQRFADADYDKSLTLPVRLLLEPGNISPDEVVRVWVDAQLNSKVQIANGIKFQFSPGRRLWLELPLYRECIGVLACQQQDKISGIDRECSDARPTTEPPPDVDFEPNDLAGLFVATDAAQACGMLGMQCCQGDVCLGTATCNGQGYCIDPAIDCGQQGQTCCPTGTPCGASLQCMGGACQTTCGGTGQTCCATGLACNQGEDKCIQGSCQPCGAIGQQCCPGPLCDGVLSICDSSNVCRPCGSVGELCCDNNGCLQGACQVPSTDMARPVDLTPPRDFSVPPDMSVQPPDMTMPPDMTFVAPDFGQPDMNNDDMATPTDGPVIIGDGGLGMMSLEPLGGGVPAGPARYCL